MSIKSIKKTIQNSRKKGGQDFVDYKTGTMEFIWCCDCSLRHIVIYDITRGKTPSEDKVRIRMERDDHATDLKRFFDREMSKKQKGKKKK